MSHYLTNSFISSHEHITKTTSLNWMSTGIVFFKIHYLTNQRFFSIIFCKDWRCVPLMNIIKNSSIICFKATKRAFRTYPHEYNLLHIWLELLLLDIISINSFQIHFSPKLLICQFKLRLLPASIIVYLVIFSLHWPITIFPQLPMFQILHHIQYQNFSHVSVFMERLWCQTIEIYH